MSSTIMHKLLSGAIADAPTVGQTFYIVDGASTFSAGQADGTGFINRGHLVGPNRVFMVAGSTTPPGIGYATYDDAMDAAITAAVAGRNDTILHLPGDYRATDSIAVNKRGLRIMGPRVRHPRRSLVTIDGDTTAGLADEIFNVTAADVEIAYLKFIPDSGFPVLDMSAAADGLHVHDCFFDFFTPAISVLTRGLVAIGAASNVRIEDCYWECDGAQGAAIVAAGLLDSEVVNCYFAAYSTPSTSGTWASPFDVGAATNRLEIRRCRFQTSSGGTMTAAIDGANATVVGGVKVAYCEFQAPLGAAPVVPIDNFDASECVLIECYLAGAGAGAGGTLITATT